MGAARRRPARIRGPAHITDETPNERARSTTAQDSSRCPGPGIRPGLVVAPSCSYRVRLRVRASARLGARAGTEFPGGTAATPPYSEQPIARGQSAREELARAGAPAAPRSPVRRCRPGPTPYPPPAGPAAQTTEDQRRPPMRCRRPAGPIRPASRRRSGRRCGRRQPGRPGPSPDGRGGRERRRGGCCGPAGATRAFTQTARPTRAHAQRRAARTRRKPALALPAQRAFYGRDEFSSLVWCTPACDIYCIVLYCIIQCI